MTDRIRRYGQRAALFRCLAAAMLVMVCLPAAVCGSSRAHAENDPDQAKQRLKETKRALEAARQKEDSLSKDIKSLASERARLNKLLIDTAKRVKTGEASLSKIESRLGELYQQEKRIRGSIGQRYGTLAKLLAAMQRMGRQPPPVMTTHRDDALKMVRSAMLLASVYPQLVSQARSLADELSNLTRVIASIKSQALQLRAENEKLGEERARIKDLMAAKKARIARNQTAIGEIQRAASEYAKNVNSLTELLKKLDREVAERAGLGKYEAELAAKGNKNAAGLQDDLTKTAALLSPGRLKPARPFSQSKGILPLPISGRRIKDFGTANEYGGKSKGILIESRADAQITSPADGWIVFAGVFRSYGQLLIINAGGGYHILLAGMNNIDVSEGQFVLAGEPVATMGPGAKSQNGKQSPPPVLYVEFRKDGHPINPDPWWSDGPEKAQG